MSTCKTNTPIDDLSICSSYWWPVDWFSPLMKAYIYITCISIIGISIRWCIGINTIFLRRAIVVFGLLFAIFSLNRFIGNILT